MKKFKLLKDLPDLKAGVIFCQSEEYENECFYYVVDNELRYYSKTTMLNNPDWFTPYLFTTEDGVDIFVGDKVYCLYEKSLIDSFNISKSIYEDINKKTLFFSTKEKVEEYFTSLQEFKVGDIVFDENGKLCKIHTVKTLKNKFNNNYKVYELQYECGSIYSNILENIRHYTNEEIIKHYKQKGWIRGVKFLYIPDNKIYTFINFFTDKDWDFENIRINYEESLFYYGINLKDCRILNEPEIIKYYEDLGWVEGAYIYNNSNKEIVEIIKTFVDNNFFAFYIRHPSYSGNIYVDKRSTAIRSYSLLPLENIKDVLHYKNFIKDYVTLHDIKNCYFYNKKIYSHNTVAGNLMFIDNNLCIGVKDLINDTYSKIPLKECLVFATKTDVINYIVKNYSIKVKSKVYKIKNIYINPGKEYCISTICNNHFIYLDCELIKELNYPKTWGGLGNLKGFYIMKDNSQFYAVEELAGKSGFKGIYAEDTQSWSALAFAQLSQLHKAMIDEYNRVNNCDWKPDYFNEEKKWYIELVNDYVTIKGTKTFSLRLNYLKSQFKQFVFPTKELAEFSLEHHKELWEQYYEL